MREADKGWRHSAKLQAALAAGLVVICVWLTNLHDEQIVLRVLAICEVVIVAALGGHVTMAVGQTIMDRFSKSNDTFVPDPKDVDDPSVP